MAAPSTHKLDNALRAALDDLGQATAEEFFAFLRPDRIEAHAAELAGDDPDARVSATWIRKLASRHGGFDKAAFGLKMLERSLSAREAAAEINVAAYEQTIEAIRGGAGREVVGPGVIAYLKRRTEADDNESRAGHLVNQLALAAANAPGGSGFREVLQRYYRQSQGHYVAALAAGLEAADRTMVEGKSIEQLAHAVAALLEGYASHTRSGAEFDEEELVDAFLRLIAAHTHRKGEAGLYPDRALFGRPRLDVESEPISGSTLSAASIYGTVIDAVAEAEPGDREVIRHAMLHGPTGSPTAPRTERSRAMAEAIYGHVQAGGELRLLVDIDTSGQLHRTLATQGELLGPDPQGRLEVRALIGVAPMVSPLIVGRRFACVGREGDREKSVVNAIQLLDPASIEILTAGFDDTWSSPKAITLISDSEPYPRGIRAAEAELGEQPD